MFPKFKLFELTLDNQVIPVLAFVGLVFIPIGLACIAASNKVYSFIVLSAILYANLYFSLNLLLHQTSE
jgi:hypothetical protein